MDEKPREPGVEREEVVERREVVERDAPAEQEARVERDPPVHHAVREPRGGTGWLWAIPLLLVVLLLLWYVFTRGEPTQIQAPDIEAPTVEAPQREQNIEINLPERTADPAPTAEPNTEPPSQ